MIVPMKKYSFLVYHREYLSFLEGIQDLGVLHVIEKESGEIENDELRQMYHTLNEMNAAIKFLSKRQTEKYNENSTDDTKLIVSELKKIWADEDEYRQKLTHAEKEAALLNPWGNFDLRLLEKLEEEGISVSFRICPVRNYHPDWEENYYLTKIDEIAGQVYFVVFEKKDEPVEINAEELKLPARSLKEIQERIRELKNILAKTEEVYDDYATKYLHLLESERKQLMAALDFQKVILSTSKEAEERLMFLEGWVPKDKEEEINKHLEQTGVYYVVEKPADDDRVPIKLKNSKFSRLFEPIGKLYMLPVYKELDLTPFFAPFFMLFFGFCLGDAGYGLIILLASLLLRPRIKPTLKPFLNLGIFFSLATILFGVLSGTFFGINLIDSGYTLTQNSIASLAAAGVPNEVLNHLNTMIGVKINSQSDFLKKVAENVSNPDVVTRYKEAFIRYAKADIGFIQNIRYMMLDTNSMMKLSLLIGYIQIIFGMFIRAFGILKFRGIRHAASSFGWAVMALGGGILYFLNSKQLVTPETFKYSIIALLVITGTPIFFYNSPGKNIFLNLGLGIWDAYGMVSGFVGDLLSYIRLFALGLSSAVLGMVFNKLAISLLDLPPGLGQILFIVLLIVGHTLNIFLASLGSFVHPMRLTFVEFYKNAGFTGGGKEYKPFGKSM